MSCPCCKGTDIECTGRDDDLDLIAYMCIDCGCEFVTGDDEFYITKEGTPEQE